MLRSLKSFITLIVLVLLLGCNIPGGPDKPAVPVPQISPSSQVFSTPKPGPNPTETVPPLSAPTATGTFTPGSIPMTAIRKSSASPTITLTPTLDPTNILLRIAAPGPMSKVVSPINFVTYISPEYTGSTRIQLLGEDGRELFGKVFRTYSNIGSSTRVEEKINFEIHGAAEVGRLQISTIDEFGRMQAYNSVRLLLLSVGENQFTQAYPPLERVLLRLSKKNDEVIGGGVLNVEGEIQPVNDMPVALELYDTDGKSLGSRILTLQHADGTYQSFSTTIPYQVSKQTVARLLVHQADDRIGGLAYLYSLKLLIAP